MRFFQSPDGSWIGRSSNGISVRPSVACPVCYSPADRLEPQVIVVDEVSLRQTRHLRCTSCGARLEVFEEPGD
jgi:hypothetical protein